MKVNRFIYWTPRILTILFLLFLAMFSLDVISPEYTFWEIMLGLFMHNIPVFVLLTVLIISWKYEIVGGVLFIAAGLFYILLLLKNFQHHMIYWILFISGPAFLIGILFLINWFKKR